MRHALLYIGLLFITANAGYSQQELRAHWRFDQVQTTNDHKTFVTDQSGNGNNLQIKAVSGEALELKRNDFALTYDKPLAYYNFQKSWTIELSLMSRLLGTEQVFLCKEGAKGQLFGDVSIGYDNMQKRFFAEVMCADGLPRRIAAGEEVIAAKWYDVRAHASFNAMTNRTTLQIEVKASDQRIYSTPSYIEFDGPAMRSDAGAWVIGRGFPGGFPNSLSVLDGAIKNVRISGEAMPRKLGQNPLFTDAFTADPAALVVGERLYLYVGQDKAGPGGWFNMPDWLCYSTTDMKNWTAHGPVLAAKDFLNANSWAAWAAQVVEKDGKYYFYATLDRKEGHFITVAVADNPLGPFKEARPGKPLITDDMTKDSHRANSDIDPTVFIDDDGTPWMAWGNGDCYMVRLNKNMVELDGPIMKVPFRNFSEGPWLFKRGDLYYNVYAADAPGVQQEQICYSMAPSITGPWTYGGFITGPAKHGFTIHPSVVEFKGNWYFFYHDGAYDLNGTPGGDCRRQVCVEYLHFNPDGSIKPIVLTTEGVSSI